MDMHKRKITGPAEDGNPIGPVGVSNSFSQGTILFQI